MHSKTIQLNGHTIATVLIDPSTGEDGVTYGLQIERKCPVTEGWFSLKGDGPIFGFVSDGSDIEAQVRTVVDNEWDIETEFLSPEALRKVERNSLDGKIGEKLQAFFDLEASVGGSPLSSLAREIFDLYSDLNEKVTIELEECQ